MSELDKINSAFVALQNAGRSASEQLQTVATLTEELAVTFAKAKTLDDMTIKALCDAVLSAADCATHNMAQPIMLCQNLAFVSRKLVRAIIGDKSDDEYTASPVAHLLAHIAKLEKQLASAQDAAESLRDRNKVLHQNNAALLAEAKASDERIAERERDNTSLHHNYQTLHDKNKDLQDANRILTATANRRGEQMTKLTVELESTIKRVLTSE